MMNKHLRRTTATIAMIVCSSLAVQAEEMVYAAWGGPVQEKMKKAFSEELVASGVKVIEDGPMDYGKLQSMIEAGQVTWDVADVEADYARHAAKKGLLEKLDFSVIDKTHLDPRFVTEYSVGSFGSSYIISCNTDVAKKCPTNWVEMFDTENFPGKRGFYKWSGPSVLEGALLADGVKPEDLYPLDLDRAFKKLDTIKSDILWWSTGAQSQQLLLSGETPFGSLWSGRVELVIEQGAPIEISWDQNIMVADAMVIPKGAKNIDAAMRFIAEAVSPKAQAQMAVETYYAPLNSEAVALMPPARVPNLPSSQTKTQINIDLEYWADYRDEISARWYEWQAGG